MPFWRVIGRDCHLSVGPGFRCWSPLGLLANAVACTAGFPKGDGPDCDPNGFAGAGELPLIPADKSVVLGFVGAPNGLAPEAGMLEFCNAAKGFVFGVPNAPG